jgi:hypothetical protein
MLIISGSAQHTLDNSTLNNRIFKKGDLHTFTLFSNNEDLESSLSSIESYLNKLGWDDITIEETQLIQDSAEFDHAVLKEGFEKANKEGFAVVINNDAVSTIEMA